MKLAFLYGGQGSQKEKMGLDFYENSPLAKKIYDNFPCQGKIKEGSFYGDADFLKRTKNAQLSIVAFQVMVNDLLKAQKIHPEAYCGLSIGEYGALHGCQVLRGEEAIRIADFRGRAMEQACKGIDTKMYALLTADVNIVEEAIGKHGQSEYPVEISNINSPKQIVIGGERQALRKVLDFLKDRKIPQKELNVSGPFHTSYMDPVALQLEEFFKGINFGEVKGGLYLNYTGGKYQGENLKEIMKNQVNNRVLLHRNLLAMMEDGVDTYIEIGFNRVLEKIVKKMNPKARVFPMANFQDYQRMLEEIYGK